MRMRILLLLIMLSLASCYVLLPRTNIRDGFTPAGGLLTSENVKLQFYWELGVVVRTNENHLCGDIGVSIEPSKEGTFDAKCVWRIDGWHDVNKIDYLVDEAFFRAGTMSIR